MRDIIPIEQLEEDLKEKQERKDNILSSLESLFDDAGFTKSVEKNTIDFDETEKDVKALFSIDNTTFNYTCYITTEGDNSSNYSAKGNIDGIEDAAEKFLAEFNDLLTLDLPDTETTDEGDEYVEED